MPLGEAFRRAGNCDSNEQTDLNVEEISFENVTSERWVDGEQQDIETNMLEETATSENGDVTAETTGACPAGMQTITVPKSGNKPKTVTCLGEYSTSFNEGGGINLAALFANEMAAAVKSQPVKDALEADVGSIKGHGNGAGKNLHLLLPMLHTVTHNLEGVILQGLVQGLTAGGAEHGAHGAELIGHGAELVAEHAHHGAEVAHGALEVAGHGAGHGAHAAGAGGLAIFVETLGEALMSPCIIMLQLLLSYVQYVKHDIQHQVETKQLVNRFIWKTGCMKDKVTNVFTASQLAAIGGKKATQVLYKDVETICGPTLKQLLMEQLVSTNQAVAAFLDSAENLAHCFNIGSANVDNDNKTKSACLPLVVNSLYSGNNEPGVLNAAMVMLAVYSDITDDLLYNHVPRYSAWSRSLFGITPEKQSTNIKQTMAELSKITDADQKAVASNLQCANLIRQQEAFERVFNSLNMHLRVWLAKYAREIKDVRFGSLYPCKDVLNKDPSQASCKNLKPMTSSRSNWCDSDRGMLGNGLWKLTPVKKKKK